MGNALITDLYELNMAAAPCVAAWSVPPPSACSCTGLYSWLSAEEAEVYARYIVGVLSPLSTTGSVGYQVFPILPWSTL